MNVSLSSRHTVHATNEGSNIPKCHNFGAPHGSESYRATTREVTCKKCLKALDAEVVEVEVEVEVLDVEVVEVQDEIVITLAPVVEVTVHVDMVTPTKGLVTFTGLNLGGMVLNDGRRGSGAGWSAEDEDGMQICSRGASLRAVVRVLARFFGIEGPLKIQRHDEYKQTGQTD